ncbi:sporulation stage III protein AG [Acidiphilium sp. CAG:727]|nr:sporulation stage III protein AG [Acidiphilium sp. CAG:727]
MSDERSKFEFKIKKEYALIVAVIAAAIIFAIVGGKKTTTTTAPRAGTTTTAAVAVEKTETERYVENLENKLSGTLSGVKNAGKVSVLITVDGCVESIYATDEKIVEEDGKKIVTTTIVTSAGKPMEIGKKFPDIIGVVVVAGGADDIGVKMALLDAVTTSLKISCNKVQILAR